MNVIGSEEDENGAGEEVDGGGQVEDVLPRLERPFCQINFITSITPITINPTISPNHQGDNLADGDRREDAGKGGQAVGDAHQRAGVAGGEVDVGAAVAGHAEAVDGEGQHQQENVQEVVAADGGDGQEAGGRAGEGH